VRHLGNACHLFKPGISQPRGSLRINIKADYAPVVPK
jgi:hypothetical protein